MNQKSSLPQAAKSVSQVLMSDSELARRFRGRINAIHVIDSDGSLHDDETSNHMPIGDGNIDFTPILMELYETSGIKHDWCAIDVCFWPDAWEQTARCRTAIDRMNRQLG